MNLIWDEVGIDWNVDSRDGGDHMNVSGADNLFILRTISCEYWFIYR